MRYAQVAVNIAQVSGLFDYHIPPGMMDAQPGCLVEVPFGRQRVQGVVLSLLDEPSVPETKPLAALLDPLPALLPAQIALAQWMAQELLAPLPACLNAMLPPGLSQHADTLYELNPDPPIPPDALSPLQARIIELLRQRGPLRGRQLEARLRRVKWKPAARALAAKGWVVSRPVLPPPGVRPRFVRTVQLAVPPASLPADPSALGRGAAGERRLAALRFLVNEPWQVDAPWVQAASGATTADLAVLAEQGWIILGETERWRDPLDQVETAPTRPLHLTAAQALAWQAIQMSLAQSAAGRPPKPILLHGVTGSGKTELYLQSVAQVLSQGRQAIVLVPEIALTPQTVRRFMGRFPGQVGLVHSRLSTGERYDTWRRARAGSLPVIVGPRSALFTPLADLGLIIVDECHDDTYYQSDFLPYYHAVDAALQYGALIGAQVLLGSATPLVTQWERARRENWQILRLTERISTPTGGGEAVVLPLPPVEVVDMRQELQQGNRSIFSRRLQEELERTLTAGQQAILFLNRRGSATYVFCRACGYALRCPSCDLPLTLHQQDDHVQGRLICHSCGYQRKVPRRCPQCHSDQIRHFGVGTEKVESELRLLFPHARALRMDADSVRVRGALDMILTHFANHQADILIGTQMLAKGLDLPLVTLVGVVLADIGLNFPDYRAEERTFQLLAQVTGRAGRSQLGGAAIIQTYQPEAAAIRFAASQDDAGFNRLMLSSRRRLGYPPFSRLVRLEYRHQNAASAQQAASQMAQQVRFWIEQGKHSATEVIGPAPCFFQRRDGYWRWQLILRGPDPAGVLRDRALEDWIVQVDPVDIL